MSYQDPYSAFLYHLGCSEEFKRLKEASAQDPGAYFSYGEQEYHHKARAYRYRAMLGQQYPVQNPMQYAMQYPAQYRAESQEENVEA
ncbi:hypothetical protein [Bacillus sp. T33-2]|uniref:hypothetical protein n=1 Tax=Bacillus sp. T33-2 TaxID=2054168 RepID=UPI000C7659E6|nr:hypothetical protein [Bacillus sp. T33-2]PLR89764.1 hypothetical protein CVD19_23450 [Bacillus sp. T33-2]